VPRYRVGVPRLTGDALPRGTLRRLTQPQLVVDDRLILRPWRSGDIPAIRAAFATPDIQRWHVLRIDSDDEAQAWIDDWARRWAAELDASWAITRAGGGTVVGQVGLRTVMLFASEAQLSYWVMPAARGAGIAALAARAVADWTFDAVGLNRLFLKHSVANAASCRVALRAGFRTEGTLRGHLLHADGFHDCHIHARLRTDTG
jgi:[ribosomal protein S5]-alanine N-acetyltransferase